MRSGSKVSDCVAALSGGALYYDEGKAEIYDSVIEKCRTTGVTGAAIFFEKGSLMIEHSRIEGCSAALEGGSVVFFSGTFLGRMLFLATHCLFRQHSGCTAFFAADTASTAEVVLRASYVQESDRCDSTAGPLSNRASQKCGSTYSGEAGRRIGICSEFSTCNEEQLSGLLGSVRCTCDATESAPSSRVPIVHRTNPP